MWPTVWIPDAGHYRPTDSVYLLYVYVQLDHSDHPLITVPSPDAENTRRNNEKFTGKMAVISHGY